VLSPSLDRNGVNVVASTPEGGMKPEPRDVDFLETGFGAPVAGPSIC